jgi:hypothetical protein
MVDHQRESHLPTVRSLSVRVVSIVRAAADKNRRAIGQFLQMPAM